MAEDPAVTPISATIYVWQREALEKYQEKTGVRTLSEALRMLISEHLPRPVSQPEAQEQPA